MFSETFHGEYALVLALALVGATLGTLPVGYEPVGGDPDRMYRPLKCELSRALKDGHLPFWSQKFGLGVPLVAESHVAAFYPPNLVLYRVLDVSTAYRLSMWLHYLALVATTYGYARCLGVAPWGSAIAAIAFTLCGFQAIHSSHEPFYLLMPYLPLSLLVAERFMSTGRIFWLAILAISLAMQWTLGHFQIQTWTGGLVIVTGFWRMLFDHRPWRRAFALILATGWGMAIAGVQLGLTWELAEFVRQTNRNISELLFYSFPPTHWFEPALPRLVRELRLGPEDPYWFGEQTTGYEAVLYVGTIPLILAVIGVLGKPASRASALWRVIVPASFVIATMPRWWPLGYIYLLSVPPLGFFRVPARYTLLTAFGMAILAGEGFDLAHSRRQFAIGVFAAMVLGGAAAAAAVSWLARRDVHLQSGFFGTPDGLIWAALAWIVALSLLFAWRDRRLRSWVLLVAVAAELGLLYYNGTTEWGWSIALPRQSAILTRLSELSNARLIGGELSNLPIRANLTTGTPYLGFAHTYPNKLLVLWERWLFRDRSAPLKNGLDPGFQRRWLRRNGVTHLVGHGSTPPITGKLLGSWKDDVLGRLVYRPPDESAPDAWSIVELDEPFAEARAVARARKLANLSEIVNRLSHSDDPGVTYYLTTDHIADRPDARLARLISWDGTVATVEHEGACDLVLARTYFPGWLARIDQGPEQPVLSADGGFQSVRINGSGIRQVSFRYQPTRIIPLATLSIVAGSVALLTLAVAALTAIRSRSVSNILSPITG